MKERKIIMKKENNNESQENNNENQENNNESEGEIMKVRKIMRKIIMKGK